MVYIYSSLGTSYSMKRYLNGVLQGMAIHRVEYDKVGVPEKRNPFFKLWYKYLYYPLQALKRDKEGGKHLIVSERYAYLAPFIRKGRTIVVCHDLHTLYPEANVAYVHRLIYKLMLYFMSKADQVICVSNHTKNDLLKFCPTFPKSKIKVVYNAMEDSWLEKGRGIAIADEDFKSLFKKHKVLLSVGTDAWYKNFGFSLNILKALPKEYVMVKIGQINTKSWKGIYGMGLNDKVYHFSHVSDALLKYAYHHALCLLFPSKSEGFGWPLAEALLCGCPVISLGNEGVRELINGGVIDVSNELEAVEKIKNIEEVDRQYSGQFFNWGKQVKALLEL